MIHLHQEDGRYTVPQCKINVIYTSVNKPYKINIYIYISSEIFVNKQIDICNKQTDI